MTLWRTYQINMSNATPLCFAKIGIFWMSNERREGQAYLPDLLIAYCWFSHDITKIQTTKLSILPRFYFHDVLEQLKTNLHTNFCFKRVLGFVLDYAWISKLLRDATFTWRPRELSRRLKKWLISGNFAILIIHVLEKVSL